VVRYTFLTSSSSSQVLPHASPISWKPYFIAGWINLAPALHISHHCAWRPHLSCYICYLTYGNSSRPSALRSL